MFRLQELILGVPSWWSESSIEQPLLCSQIKMVECVTGFVNKWASGWVRLSEWASAWVSEWQLLLCFIKPPAALVAQTCQHSLGRTWTHLQNQHIFGTRSGCSCQSEAFPFHWPRRNPWALAASSSILKLYLLHSDLCILGKQQDMETTSSTPML